jgi:hypothetical protein
MPHVKTLRAHQNAYGDKYEKEPGDSYNHPSPQTLVDGKIVEITDEGDAQAPRARRSRKRTARDGDGNTEGGAATGGGASA